MQRAAPRNAAIVIAEPSSGRGPYDDDDSASSGPATSGSSTDVPVMHHESRTPGRYDKYLANRAVYLDRWQRVDEPRDDAALWATRGLRVVDHEVGPARHGEPPRLRDPAAGAGARGPARSRESTRGCAGRSRTRRPPGPGGERWGDTHFADSLAAALREHGQEVVVDRRPEFDRATGRHDDVVLVLRGLVRHDPSPEQVSLLWVISHPDEVTAEEARGYDRVRRRRRGRGPSARTREWGAPGRAAAPGHRPGAVPPRRRQRPAPATTCSSSATPAGSCGRSSATPSTAGLPLAVYGDLWTGLVPDEVVAGRSIPNDELAAAYARPASSSTTTTTTCGPTASSPTGSSTRWPAAPGWSPTRWPGWPSCSAPRSRSTRRRRPAPAGHAGRPRRGLRRRRRAAGRRRPGPLRALLRRPRRAPDRGRPRGPGRAQARVVRTIGLGNAFPRAERP